MSEYFINFAILHLWKFFIENFGQILFIKNFIYRKFQMYKNLYVKFHTIS